MSDHRDLAVLGAQRREREAVHRAEKAETRIAELEKALKWQQDRTGELCEVNAALHERIAKLEACLSRVAHEVTLRLDEASVDSVSETQDSNGAGGEPSRGVVSDPGSRVQEEEPSPPAPEEATYSIPSLPINPKAEALADRLLAEARHRSSEAPTEAPERCKFCGTVGPSVLDPCMPGKSHAFGPTPFPQRTTEAWPKRISVDATLLYDFINGTDAYVGTEIRRLAGLVFKDITEQRTDYPSLSPQLQRKAEEARYAESRGQAYICGCEYETIVRQASLPAWDAVPALQKAYEKGRSDEREARSETARVQINHNTGLRTDYTLRDPSSVFAGYARGVLHGDEPRALSRELRKKNQSEKSEKSEKKGKRG